MWHIFNNNSVFSWISIVARILNRISVRFSWEMKMAFEWNRVHVATYVTLCDIEKTGKKVAAQKPR